MILDHCMGLLALLISMMEFGEMTMQKILIQKLQSIVMGFCYAQLTDHEQTEKVAVLIGLIQEG